MSGPVGGAIGASVINRDNLIGFDIGGTSFDVSIIVNNRMETTVEAEIEGFPVLAPTSMYSALAREAEASHGMKQGGCV